MQLSPMEAEASKLQREVRRVIYVRFTDYNLDSLTAAHGTHLLIQALKVLS
jgi:hypothetical protein